MLIKNATKKNAIYLQIGIGLFTNLLMLYSTYIITSIEYGSQSLGLLNCSFSTYQYRWLVDASYMLSVINAFFYFFSYGGKARSI